MKRRNDYEVYLVLDNKKTVLVGATDNIEDADAIYAMYIKKVKRGGKVYFNAPGCDSVAVKVYVLCTKNNARFSYSLAEGFKEEFRKAA